eukprot:gene57346-biopygen35636
MLIEAAVGTSYPLVDHRLYRHHCTVLNNKGVKDLSLLGRPLSKVCIVDNNPYAYRAQPRNSLAVSPATNPSFRSQRPHLGSVVAAAPSCFTTRSRVEHHLAVPHILLHCR